MSMHDLKKYKLAKILVIDLANIVALMLEYESKLSKYQKYAPIKKLLINTKENRTIVQHHLRKQKEIVKSKGKEIETTPLLGDGKK